jgi:K+-transporting ATPase ATPase B chain
MTRKVLTDSVKRLSPLSLISNPVMLVVEATFLIVSGMAVYPPAFYPVANASDRVFYIEVAVILLITVWFSTLSDSLAETQVKSTANSLRSLEGEVVSKKIVGTERGESRIVQIPSTQLSKGDLIFLEKDDLVPIDADVLEGIGMVDESLVTGESAPVKKAPGDVLIGGSTLTTDSMVARVTVDPEESYINKMIKMVEAAKRPKTPNEQAVSMIIIGLTAIFTVIIFALAALSVALNLGGDLSVMIALYVCLLPTTIGALLPSIGLSGISRLYKKRVVAKLIILTSCFSKISSIFAT